MEFIQTLRKAPSLQNSFSFSDQRPQILLPETTARLTWLSKLFRCFSLLLILHWFEWANKLQIRVQYEFRAIYILVQRPRKTKRRLKTNGLRVYIVVSEESIWCQSQIIESYLIEIEARGICHLIKVCRKKHLQTAKRTVLTDFLYCLKLWLDLEFESNNFAIE